MKKKLLILVCAICFIFPCIFLFNACSCSDNSYKIKFLVFNNVYSSVETVGNAQINTPSNPVVEGYTFEGWYLDDSFNQPFDKNAYINIAIQADINVYGKFIANEYTINFVSGEGSNNIEPIIQDFGSAVTEPTQKPKKTGYTFEGWYIDNETFNNKYIFTTMPLNGITLYAKFVPSQFTITFVTNSGSEVEPITQEYKSTVTPPTSPTKEGCEFEGWYTDDKTFKHKYTFTTMPLGGITLYAKFVTAKYTINFVTNGGSEVDSITQYYNSLVTPPTSPTKEGYTFVGWFTDNESFNNEYTFTTMPLNGLTLYAKFIPNQYTITFETDGGSVINSITQDYQSNVSAPINPTKEGYTFEGWFTDNGTFNSEYVFTTMPLGGITLYAKFVPSQFTITFVSTGSAVEPITQEYNSVVTAPENPTREGYEFEGWYIYDGFFTIKYEFTTMPLGGIVLYSKFTPNQYTITFESNGGSAVEPITQYYAYDVTAPENPTRENYEFLGWFTDNETFKNKFEFDFMPLNGITLYAKWQSIFIVSETKLTGLTSFGKTLTNINVPQGITEIGDSVFYYSLSLKTVTLPEGIVKIGASSFSRCTSLTNINIPSSVETIGNSAFYNCLSLTNVTISQGLKKIGDSAFYKCIKLASVVLPDTLETIEDFAFMYCSSLSSLTIPKNLNQLGLEIFGYCSKLSSIVVDENNAKYDSRDNCNAIIESSSNTLVYGCKSTVIPNTVTDIRYYAFSGSAELTNIIIPESVKTIGDYAFYNCASLTNIIIPESVTALGDAVFNGCSSLEDVIISKAVISIGYALFGNCENLKEIIFKGTQEEWEVLNVGEGNSNLVDGGIVIKFEP